MWRRGGSNESRWGRTASRKSTRTALSRTVIVSAIWELENEEITMSVHIHHFKIHPEPFEQVVLGFKRHEIRRDDRSVRPRTGDLVVLREWRPIGDDGDYTGREVKKRVTHVTDPGTWGLPSDLYVMSI